MLHALHNIPPPRGAAHPNTTTIIATTTTPAQSPNPAAPKEEDARLLELVHRFGAQNWTIIARNMGAGRNGKSCRLRWFNQLDPRVNKEPFSEAEVRPGGGARHHSMLQATNRKLCGCQPRSPTTAPTN